MIDPTPWLRATRPGPRGEAIVLTTGQRAAVEDAIRPATAEKRIVQRGQALLLMADGVSPGDVAKLMGVHERTAWEWKARFARAEDPVSALADAPRSGRPPSLSRTPTLRESRAKPADPRLT